MSYRGHFYKPNANPGAGRKQRVAAYLDGAAGRQGKLFTNMIPVGMDLRKHPCAPLIAGAIQFYGLGYCKLGGSNVCISCKCGFAAGGDVAAHFVSYTHVGSTDAVVSGICRKCWRTKSESEIDSACTLALRRILARGRFLDPVTTPGLHHSGRDAH